MTRPQQETACNMRLLPLQAISGHKHTACNVRLLPLQAISGGGRDHLVTADDVEKVRMYVCCCSESRSLSLRVPTRQLRRSSVPWR